MKSGFKYICFICVSLFAAQVYALDPSNWSDKTVCRLTVDTNNIEYIEEAKIRGLACGKTVTSTSKTLAKAFIVANLPKAKPNEYDATANVPKAKSNGYDTTFVKFDTGTLEQSSSINWIEYAVDGITPRFTWQVENRDEWSIYLTDKSRGMYMQIDMYRMWVQLSWKGQPKYDFKKIISAQSKNPNISQSSTIKLGDVGEAVKSNVPKAKSNGYDTTFVKFDTGTLEQSSSINWIEYAVDGITPRFTWQVENRDEWSIYLTDKSRGMYMQIDMYRMWVQLSWKGQPKYDFKKIISAQSKNPNISQSSTIKLGDMGKAVKSIQKKLNIKVDGVFGYSTDLAFRNWQALNGLTPDGVADNEAQRILFGKIINSTSEGNLIAAPGVSSNSPIYYNQLIGIFSESEPVRLDIGTRAMKENIPASHNSWATRFRIKRLDGPNRGEVFSHHTIGIFAASDPVRLDIGTRAMKENVPASHNSWATQLFIQRLDGPNRGPIHYGDVVGVFSSDRKVRLDIGTRATQEDVPASHNSWGTRLRILLQD